MSNDNGEVDQKTEDFISTVNARREMYTKAVQDDKMKMADLNNRLNSEMGISVSTAAREQYIQEMQEALKTSAPVDE